MAKKELFDYEIDCINPTDYELKINLKAKNRIFMLIFNRTKNLLQKRNIKITGKIEEIQHIEIPANYLQLIKISLKKIMASVSAIFKADGIQIMTYDVSKACFKKKDQNTWDIEILVKGLYTDKR